nr:ferredoxin--NADP reductase [Dietzia psychralcaliphila]
MSTSPATARSTVLTVDRLIAETADAITIVFDRPGDPSFEYRPGQFLTLRVPSDRNGSVARCYSLCSAPHDDELAVTVKRTAEGYGSNWLCDNVRAGSHVEVLPPSGAFVPESTHEDLLLVGGGSGITPLMSILRTTLESGTGRIALVYANRDENSVIFAAALRALVERYPHRLTIVHWLTSVQGIPTRAALAAMLAPFADRTAFVCGPAAFMDTTHATLDGLGVHRDRIHVERFLSLSGDPFAAHDVDLAAAAALDDRPARATVTLDGKTHSLRWPRSLTLVDVLLAHDIEAPYACREGECGSCVCIVVEGEVDMDASDTLDPADVEEGYVLGCQARPNSDHVVIEY